jgi:putative ABC transport system permease protein
MKLSDLLLTAGSNMLRARVRTILTVVAIVIGAMTITLTNGIGSGVKSYLNQQIGDLGARNVLFVQLTGTSSSPNSAPAKYRYNPRGVVSSSGLGQTQLLMGLQDLAAIKAIPDITSVVPAHSFAPDYIVDNSSPQDQISIPQSYVAPLGYRSNQSIVGKTVRLGITSGKGSQVTVTATVTGVQQKNVISHSTAYANDALSNQLNNIQNAGVPAAVADTFLTAYATFPSALSAAQVNTIEGELSAKGFSAKTIKNEENTIFSTIDAIIIVFDLFGAVALLAASFGIINTLFMAVQERTKEIGLMKALGMSPRRIFALFSGEALLIGFCGSILGIGIAVVIGKVVNAIGKHGFLKNFPGLSLLTFPFSTIAAVILGIMLIAFLAGTLPAIRASRKDPIAALRYE